MHLLGGRRGRDVAGAGRGRYFAGTAWLVLAVAALTVNADATRGIAGWFYPAGVSLYSDGAGGMAGLVLGGRDPPPAAWRAAWLFAHRGMVRLRQWHRHGADAEAGAVGLVLAAGAGGGGGDGDPPPKEAGVPRWAGSGASGGTPET